MSPPFTFVLGCQRSGTTLLRSMLDAHPRLAVSNEARFPASMVRTRSRYERANGFDGEGFLRDLATLPGTRTRLLDWQIPTEDLADWFRTRAPTSVPDAVRAVYELYAHRHGKSLYGDKTPGYTRDVSQLGANYLDPRVVHIIRDGRDVALGLVDAPFGPRSLHGAAIHWQRRVEAASKAGHELGTSKYCQIYYEDLVRDPETTLATVTSFIGIEYDPRMLQYFENSAKLAEIAPAQSSSGPVDHHESLRLPPTGGLRNWRRDMSRDDIALFDSIAGLTLAEHGYECGEGPARPFEALRLLGRKGTYCAYYLSRDLRTSASMRLGDAILERGLDQKLPRFMYS